MKRRKKVKALVLFSGGLDSILAAKLLLEQGIEIEAINFRSNFYGSSGVKSAAKMLGVPLREIDIGKEFLEVLKKPKHGYGTGLNPCIDCHILMFRKTGEIMKAEGFDFIATGEVLGERPMSQYKQALRIIEKEAGLEGYLLRPLSAKLLEPTIAEKQDLVDREKLLDISGRSRKKQIALAEKLGIKKYPSPAGGCALAQEGFARRLKELMKHKPDFDTEDAGLVGVGRHSFFNKTQIILGRSEEENQILESAFKKSDILIKPKNFIGPTALVRGGEIAETVVEKAKKIIIKFSPKVKDADIAKLTFKVINDKK